MNQKHIPVLLSEVHTILAPKTGESYLDLTAGYGGHAQKIIDSTEAAEQAVLVDRDKNAIEHLRSHLATADIRHSDAATAVSELNRAGDQFDMILADLGVSSPHLDNAERGFSFMHDGPLDMRMDEANGQTAADVVNSYSQDDLAQIIREYGEDRRAQRIARVICENRPFQTTLELASVIEQTIGRPEKKHPATRTFQALRIEVNQELQQVAIILEHLSALTKPSGRVAIISFHSLEDRLIKNFFKEQRDAGYEAEFKLLTKQPVVASSDELVHNPRARSAKLRAGVKLKQT